MNRRQKNKQLKIKIKKLKASSATDILLMTFDLNDDNFDIIILNQMFNQIQKIVPKEVSIVALPSFISCEYFSKEELLKQIDYLKETLT